MATDAPKAAPSPLSQMQTFVALASAIVGVVAAVQALSSKKEADESAKAAQSSKLALDVRAAERADKEARAKLDAIAYEAVVKVLELERGKGSEALAIKRERAVLALIAATASESMQSALFAVVQSGPSISPGVQAEAGAASDLLKTLGSQASDSTASAAPTVNSKAAADSPASLQGFRVVIFHCGSDSRPRDAQAQKLAAEKLLLEMSADPVSAKYAVRWEMKLLPSVLNASPGYKIASNQIRFNPADGETEPSLALVKLLGTAKALGSRPAAFERKTANQRTPGYLSVFVCGVTAEA